MYKNIWLSVFIILLAAGCHSSQKKAPVLPGDMSFADFKNLFPDIRLPYKADADTLQKNIPDSLQLAAETVHEFLPDSVTRKEFAKGEKIKYYPLGKVQDRELQYFFLKAVNNSRREIYVCLFNRKNTFAGSLPFAGQQKKNTNSIMIGRMDTRRTITQNYITRDGARTLLREDVYSASPNGLFTLVLTNANEPNTLNEIYNPIDTLPRRHKYSGDYTSGKLSIVSIRDGKDAKSFYFFIHFYKEKENCTGEIDGKGKFTSSNTGIFHEDAGPCAIQFNFTPHTVTIKEVGGCGAYRGVNCFYQGSFTKRKEAVKKKKVNS